MQGKRRKDINNITPNQSLRMLVLLYKILFRLGYGQG